MALTFFCIERHKKQNKHTNIKQNLTDHHYQAHFEKCPNFKDNYFSSPKHIMVEILPSSMTSSFEQQYTLPYFKMLLIFNVLLSVL